MISNLSNVSVVSTGGTGFLSFRLNLATVRYGVMGQDQTSIEINEWSDCETDSGRGQGQGQG